MWTPAPRRQFKSGEVRIVGTRFNGRIGYLCEDNGNGEEERTYLVILYGGEGPDENFSASELIPWVPKVGDWVTEIHSDGDEVGIIIANDGNHITRTMENVEGCALLRRDLLEHCGPLAGDALLVQQ